MQSASRHVSHRKCDQFIAQCLLIESTTWNISIPRLPSRENHLSATYMDRYINMNVDKRKHATNLGVIFDCKRLPFPLETFPDFLYPEKFDEGTTNR